MRKSLFLAFYLFSMSIKAELIKENLYSVGDNLLTYDSATNLEWLNVSATVGLSLSDVYSSQFMTTQHFRFATRNEVGQLWMNAWNGQAYIDTPTHVFYWTISQETYTELYNPALKLVNLLGCTSDVVLLPCDGFEQNWHIGRYNQNIDGDFSEQLAVVDYFGPSDRRSNSAAMLLDFGTVVGNSSVFQRTDIGNYLVRNLTNIPLPSGFTLFLSAIGVLILISKTNQNSLKI